MAHKGLTDEDIKHLATLANLQISNEEADKFKNQLSETLHYIENLKELKTDNVTPTNHTSNKKNVYFEDGKECERMLTQEEALSNAKDKKNKYFIVKRIM